MILNVLLPVFSSMDSFREEVRKDDKEAQKKKLEEGGGYSASRGYGGKYE